MTTPFQTYLGQKLSEIDEVGLRRKLREIESVQGAKISVGARKLLNFSSNDYLGLARHPALKESTVEAVRLFGAGAGSARLISGSLAVLHELEAAAAAFKGAEASLSFSSGYAAALGTVPVLVGEGDIVVVDKLVHSSLVDAARLSGAKLRVFKHNDLVDLERILKWARESGVNTLIITESVFSMDGDIAPLENIVKLKEAYGAWLMLDEAHAVGLYGKGRRGIAEELEVTDRVEVQMGTLGKALGAAGGLICGSQALVDLLINRARSFIYSTAPVPAQAAAARQAIELICSDEGGILQTRLWKNVEKLKNSLTGCGWKLPAMQSAILPLIVGAEDDAVALSERLLEAGIWVPAVRYPTVARGEARLRITVSAAHTDEDIEILLEALGGA
ncbi:MAG: 8-amino-7-oxononanoate synthase [Verrucomicrobiota bacterium]|jgi:8-amino-7-oxononanoate synthase|nr:8-amino-7-oxononanoate synthase [Verrucomicrobiota bacterium]